MGRKGILVCALAFLLSACSPTEPEAVLPSEETEASEEPREDVLYLSLAACGDWTESSRGQVLQEQIDQLEENSGLIRIRFYDRSQLGDEARLIQGVRLGTLDLVQSIPATQTGVVPEAALLEVPGLFASLEEWNQFLSGEYRQIMESYYAENGLKLLTLFASSYRQLSSSQDLTDPETLQGLPVRVIENEYHETFWRSLGAEPVPYAFEELRFCLQEGIAQAQENPVGTMLEEELMDVQSTLTLTNHMPMIYVLAMNRERFEELSREQQDQLTAFGESLQADMIRRLPELEQQNLETLQNDYGISVQEPSPAWEGRIRQGQQAVLELLRSNLGNEKVDQMLQAAAAAGADLGQ